MQGKQGICNCEAMETKSSLEFCIWMVWGCQDTNGTGASRNYIGIMGDGTEWSWGEAQAA